MGPPDSQPAVYMMIISLITVIFSCGFNDGVVALVMGTSPPAGPEKQFTALFAFGDSLTDNGNNNYFLSSLAKANYVPYGVDFEEGPSGRFSNGRTSLDYIGNY
ncbi:hypothetical protein RHMOL_Rhmol10G0187600 [Rhododendron molle]|uniref:Uncharacterized protein n=1 Tax=Rhododendron molle TaxID=49168 RepID=A0ACC0M415_RHOML|nr:hypothetical protein RHMOL_Rhmol10G0187600 [Rhododendron molle]